MYLQVGDELSDAYIFMNPDYPNPHTLYPQC